MRERTLGPEHPDVAESVSNRARLLTRQVRPERFPLPKGMFHKMFGGGPRLRFICRFILINYQLYIGKTHSVTYGALMWAAFDRR